PPENALASHHAEAEPLLRAALESAVRHIRDLVVVTLRKLTFGQESGRMPPGAVELDPAVDARGRAQVLHQASVKLAHAVIAVRPPAILALAPYPEDAVISQALPSAECGALEPAECAARSPHLHPVHVFQGPHVYGTRHREVAVHRAGGTLDHVHR